MKKIVLFTICLCIGFSTYGKMDEEEKNLTRINFYYPTYDTPIIQTEDFTRLYSTSPHPNLIESLSLEEKVSLLEEVNQRRRDFGRDTLTSADQFYIWKPYIYRLHHEDPHHRMVPAYTTIDKKFKQENVKVLSFSYLLINDTLIVDHSLNPKFKKGDMVLSINDVAVSKYLDYTYKDRYGNAYMLNHCYNSNFAPEYSVDILRNNKPATIITEGGGLFDVEFELNKGDDYKVQLFEDAKCGYIAVDEFPSVNSYLIKKVRSGIKYLKEQGYTNVILDLRKNPGGSGDDFDKLMSIFINKPTVKYLKGAKIRASVVTIDNYDFLTKEMDRTVVDMPEGGYVKEFITNPKMYIDGMAYYVLISRNTASMAASFVNILQYNDVAILVGEPLAHNALKYGDVSLNWGIYADSRLIGQYCTTQIDEYTKAVNGVLIPDIHIPYVANDYLTGEDAMLEKLLEHILSINTKEASVLTKKI